MTTFLRNALLVLALTPSLAWGASFTISMDTSQLVGNTAGPFALDFQLNDGGDGSTNTAILSDFQFGTGGFTGFESLLGGVSVGADGTISLVDSDFINSFTQGFNPGTDLSFRLNLTTNAPAAFFPDQFSFAILYTDSFGDLAEIPTTACLGAFATIDITTAPLNPTTCGSDAAFFPNVLVSAPTIALDNQTVVPEPSTILLLGTSLGALAARRRSRTRTE